MREDEEVDFLDKYPFLNEDPVYRPSTKKLFTRAQNSLAKRMHNIFLQQNEVSGNSKTTLTTFAPSFFPYKITLVQDKIYFQSISHHKQACTFLA